MTVTIADQIDRMEYLLQDRAIVGQDKAFDRNFLLTQHKDELSRLARHHVFGNILWINALQGTAQYTLPATTTHVNMVLYNEKRLDYATEAMLDRWHSGWEDWQGDPQFWTMDNQSPNTLRIVPPPLRDGSAIPLIPGPLFQNSQDNFVVFLHEDRAEQADDASDVFPLPDVFEDILVYETTAEITSRETDYQNLPLAQICRELAALYRNAVGIS